MTLLGSLFAQVNTPGTIIKSDTVEIAMDITDSQDHVFESTITSNPIEDGSQVTDHIINEPDKLTLKGMMTDSPVRFASGVQDIAEQGLGGESRSKSTFDTLKELRDSKTLVTITTTLNIYTNMAIRSFTVPRNSTTGNTLPFTLDLLKVEVVSSKTVATPADIVRDDPEGTADQGASTVDAGKQPSKAVDAVTESKSSVAFDLAKGAGIL